MQELQETQVQTLGQEDLLEKEMATHSSILAWRIPWTEEPGGLQCMASKRVRHDGSNLAHSCKHESFLSPTQCEAPEAAVTKYQAGGASGTEGSSHTFRSQSSEIKVSVGLVPSGGSAGNLLLAAPPVSGS